MTEKKIKNHKQKVKQKPNKQNSWLPLSLPPVHQLSIGFSRVGSCGVSHSVPLCPNSFTC